MKIRYLNLALRLGLLLVMTINFNLNIFNVVNTQWFTEFQLDSEGLSLGRIIKSQEKGIFSHGGFQGRVVFEDDRIRFYNDHSWPPDEVTVDGFGPYYSQSGLQSIIYSIIAVYFDLDPVTSLNLFHWLNSLLLSIIFLFFLFWVRRYCNMTVVFLLLTMIILSPWITVFGRNLYWVTWVFYFPFVFNLYYVSSKGIITNIKLFDQKTFWLSAFVILIKCLLTGFEFITTVLVSTIVPFLFYASFNKWTIRQFFNQIFSASLGMILSVFISLSLLAIQLSSVKGSIASGINYIIYSLEKRSVLGTSDGLNPIYVQSRQSALVDVIIKYLNGYSVDLRNFGELFEVRLTFGFLIGFVIVATILFNSFKSLIYDKTFLRFTSSLLIAIWGSFLAPLSWFIIFRGHSAIHTHLDYIVWFLPLMLLIYVFVSTLISKVISKIFLKKRTWF